MKCKEDLLEDGETSKVDAPSETVNNVFRLQELLCRKEGSTLQDRIERNVQSYVALKNQSKDFKCSLDTQGFVACCVDSISLLSDTLPTPPDFALSLTNQSTLDQILEFIVGFGISALCDNGVCPVSLGQSRAEHESCAALRNLKLDRILSVLQPLIHDSFYSATVLSKYLGVLIGAYVQILYGPNNPRRVIKKNMDPVAVERSRSIDLERIKTQLDEMLFLTSNVVPHIMSLQLPKGSYKAPRWLLAVSQDLMTQQVTRPNGVINVARALFQHWNVLSYEDQGFCDKISAVLIKPQFKPPPTGYLFNVATQIGSMLDHLKPGSVLRQQFLRLYKNLVHKLSVEDVELAFETVWCMVFAPCIAWTNNATTLSEADMERCIRNLETMSSLGLFHGGHTDRICNSFLLPLLTLYHHLHPSVSLLKKPVLNIIKELMLPSSCWTGIIMDFLARNDAARDVEWCHGNDGGVVLHPKSPINQALSFNPDDILGVEDCTVAVVMKLLETLQGNASLGNTLSDFFIILFRDLILSEQKQDRENYLDGPCELHHVQASLRKALLLGELCQRFGEKLLKNTTQTIELLKLIIVERAEHSREGEDGLLITSFGILSTYLRDEIQLNQEDEEQIKSLMGPLKKIIENTPNLEIQNTANDLRICIATKINVDLLNGFSFKPDQSSASLSDIIKDLKDPLIPSRAHAIMQLGKRFEARDPVVIAHVDVLQLIILDNISHNDTYIFLAAIRCLAQTSWQDTQKVLDVVTREILNTSRSADDRAKCMEVLVNMMRITNEMLPHFENQIFNCLLSCVTSQNSEMLRTSSLICLGQLCNSCKHGTLCHIQEITEICEFTLLEDSSQLAQKGAILLLSNIIHSQDKSIFFKMERESLRIYRLLKKVSSRSDNKDIENRALQCLAVLSDIVREFMFPKTKLRHEIKILDMG